MSTWTVVYEQTGTGWSAFVPALSGVVAAAATHEEAEQLISEAIALHIQALADDGLPIPDPHSVDVGQVELRQPA
ncbi:MAG: type II toxin-antitoxin system HicB family antitoxin [Acidimicrobiales bacterium]